jgi:preprotein translocase subunit SecD
MQRLGGIALLLFVAGCATVAPPPPPPPPASNLEPPPAFSDSNLAAPAPRATPLPAPIPGSGTYLLLGVDLDTVWREKLDGVRGDISGALYARHIEFDAAMSIAGDAIELRNLDAAQANELLRQICVQDGCQVAARETGRFTISLTDAFRRNTIDDVLHRSLDAVRRRLDEVSSGDPVIRLEPGGRIAALVPRYSDAETIRKMFSPPSDFAFHLVDDALSTADIAAGRTPPDVVLLDFMNGTGSQDRTPLPVYKASLLSGERISFAYPGTDPFLQMPIVTLQLDADGTTQFAGITRANVSHRIALVLRDRVVTAPVIQTPILEGRVQISGNFTEGEAARLATALCGGTGPAPWKILVLRTQ